MNNLEKIKKLLKIENKDILEFRRCHQGYIGNCYTLTTKNNKYFTKMIKMKKGVYFPGKISAEKSFNEELRGIKLMSKIKNPKIITPELVNYDKKNCLIILKYKRGKNFYSVLLKKCNKKYFDPKLMQTFYEIGKYMAEYHNKNFIEIKENEPLAYLIMDLSSHNIQFIEDKIFIFDPTSRKGSIYIDITKFMLNFYPANFFLRLKLSKEGLNQLKKSFLEGYKQHLRFKLDNYLLKKNMLRWIKEEKGYKKRNFTYIMKKIFINHYLHKLIKKIENDKINLTK